MRRALVTGISGQDGPFLAEFLLKKGYTVFGFHRPIDSDENFRHLLKQDKFHLLTGDLMNQIDIHAAMKEADPDEVYNLGGYSHVGFSFNEPVLVGDVTGLGVTRILEAIKSYNPKIKFYQAATSELFGNVNGYPQNEHTPMYPCSPYAVAKYYAYWITKHYREAYNMFACNGILFNHESERRGFNFVTRKITSTVARIKKGLEHEIRLGNLDAHKDWGYAGDYVEAMWLMLQQDKPDDYCIGTGELHTVRDFVVAAFEAVGIKVKSNGKTGIDEVYIDVATDKPVVVIDKKFYRPIDTAPMVADAKKAHNALGWKPKIKFKKLVKLMVEHDLKHL